MSRVPSHSSDELTADVERYRALLIPALVFCYQLVWVLVTVSLPFYIQEIGTDDPRATLRWTGWIIGVAPFAGVVTGPLWIRWGDKSPRKFYVLGQLIQGCCFFLTALARNLPEVFGSRLLLGTMGSPQSFALMIIGRSGKRDVRWEVSAVQSATTMGTVLAPLGMAVVGARVGYRTSFIFAGAMIVTCAAVIRLGVPEPSVIRRAEGGGSSGSWMELGTICLLVLFGYSQVFFLPSILPGVLPLLGVPPGEAVTMGGWLLFLSGLSLVVGSVTALPLSSRIGDQRAIVVCLAASSVCLGLLSTTHNAIGFAVIRSLEMLTIAPVMVLGTARVAQWTSGQAVGLVNSSRLGAAFVGPVVATNLLAWFTVEVTFGALALVGIACIPLVLRSTARDRWASGGGS